MAESILIGPEDEDYRQDSHINSHNSLHPSPKPLIIDKHLDKALKEINILLYEDVIALWKIYGES